MFDIQKEWILKQYREIRLLLDLKGQYHAIFSNTLKIEKTLFG